MKSGTGENYFNGQSSNLRWRDIKPLRLVALGMVFLLLIAATLQEENVSKCLRLFDKHKNLFPHEKVYLQTDRPYYMVGDTIWFAAYVTNAVTHQPSAISNILYTDLINSSAQVVAQQKWKIKDGFTNGQIAVEDSLMQDVYTIRAYTAWMCNFDSTLFFTKNLNVFQLFPEGFRCQAKLTSNGESQQLDVKLFYNGTNAAMVKNCPVRYRIKSSGFNIKGESVIDSLGQFNISQSFNVKKFSNPTVELQYVDNRKKKQKTEVAITLPHEPEIYVRFFPEGGQMVNGLPSRVAFEVRDERGAPLVITGMLKTSDGEVGKVESNFAGYGSFFLTPHKGMEYWLAIRHNGHEREYLLPKPQEQGVTLTCESAGARELRVKVFRKFEDPELSKNMLLVGHVRGELIFVTPIDFNAKGFAQAKISTVAYPQGVLHMTLINGKGMPCVERLVYVDNGERVKMQLETHNIQSEGRNRTVTRITTKDQEEKPVSARISLSALDESLLVLPDSAEENICTYMLLSSDLRGRIYKPGYYFGGAPRAKQDLDLLMLTQGWCRFDLDLCKADSLYPVRYPVEKKLTIVGQMNNVNHKKIKDYSVTMLSYTCDNKMYEMLYRNVRSDGSFSFVFDDYYGALTAKIFTRNHNRRLRDLNVNLIQEPQPPAAPLDHVPDLNGIAQADKKILDQRAHMEKSSGRAIMLGDVQVVAHQRDDEATPEYYSGGDKPDVVLFEKDVAKYNSVMQAILFAMPGANVKTSLYGSFLQVGSGMSQVRKANVRMLDEETGEIVGMQTGGVGIIINGMPADVDELQSLTPSEVGSIRIYRKTITGLSFIAVTTKPGAKYVPGSIITILKGFDKAKYFYTPSNLPWESQRDGYPATIFWKANIVTDSLGCAAVAWPQINRLTTIRLRAEGMTQQGVPVFSEKQYRNLIK